MKNGFVRLIGVLVLALFSGCATYTYDRHGSSSYDPCDQYIGNAATGGAAIGALGGYGLTGRGTGAALGAVGGAVGGIIARSNCRKERLIAHDREKERRETDLLQRAEYERLRAEELARQKRVGKTVTEGSSYRADDGTIRWTEEHRWEKEEEGVPPGSGTPILQPYNNPSYRQ
ncbi:MAG: hypothetical protein AAB539_01770 [Patescibacteria group bacterium]